MKTLWILALCLLAPAAARAADKAAPPDTAKMVPMTMKEVK